MYWSRFDIATAYYHYTLEHKPTQWRKYLDQLERIKYNPGLSDSRLHSISTNAKFIYMRLVKKHYGR